MQIRGRRRPHPLAVRLSRQGPIGHRRQFRPNHLRSCTSDRSRRIGPSGTGQRARRLMLTPSLHPIKGRRIRPAARKIMAAILARPRTGRPRTLLQAHLQTCQSRRLGLTATPCRHKAHKACRLNSRPASPFTTAPRTIRGPLPTHKHPPHSGSAPNPAARRRVNWPKTSRAGCASASRRRPKCASPKPM